MKDGDIVARVECERLGGQARAGLQLDDRVVLPGDDVCSRDDEVVSGRPAGPFDAHAARSAEDAHDARPRNPHARRVHEPRIRRSDRPGRSRDRRERIDARERVEDLLRRDDLVEPAQHRGPLRAVPQVGLPGEQQGDRADHPHDRQAGERAEAEPAERVKSADARLANARTERRPGERAERLEQDRAHSRSGQRGQRRVRRGPAALQERRRDA